MILITAVLLFLITNIQTGWSGECDSRQTLHPEWIFCDDFEDTGTLVQRGRYFEYDDNNGDFANVNGVGLENSHGMRTRFQQGEVGAGSIKLAFGRNPNSYMNKQKIHPDDDFREIYYRMYLKMESGWQGNDPAKLSRATCFTSATDWRQAMIAHVWSDDNAHLLIDPAGCVDASGEVSCTTYNDFDNLKWLGNKAGSTPVFATDHSDRWFCIEAHVKLNDPGQSNGIQEFWIDGTLEAQKTGLNFVGTFSQYAINAIFFENYWNAGSTKLQERYFDNIVVSTQPIGPVGTSVRFLPAVTSRNHHPDIRVETSGKQSISFRSTQPISSIHLYTPAGKLLERHEKINTCTFTINNRFAMHGLCLYTVFTTDNTLPAFSGKFVQ